MKGNDAQKGQFQIGQFELLMSSICMVCMTRIRILDTLWCWRRRVGGIRLLAWTLHNASAHSKFQELAALTAGRLMRRSAANQDTFVQAGGLQALHRLLGADWGKTRRTAGVQAAAANALADVMTVNLASKDILIREGKCSHARPQHSFGVGDICLQYREMPHMANIYGWHSYKRSGHAPSVLLVKRKPCKIMEYAKRVFHHAHESDYRQSLCP